MGHIPHVFFVSHSKLAHNLLEVVRPLLSKKIDFICFESLEDFKAYPQQRSSFVLVDWNVFKDQMEAALEVFKEIHLLKKSVFYLIYPHQDDINRLRLEECGFTGFFAKPFLTDELARIINRGIKA